MQQKWSKVKNIENLIHINQKSQNQIPAFLNHQRRVDTGTQIKVNTETKENTSIERISWKDPESFGNMMKNSVVAQDAVLDDIHKEMENEGINTQDTETQIDIQE